MTYFRLLLVTASIFCCTLVPAQLLPEGLDTLPLTTAHYHNNLQKGQLLIALRSVDC